MLRNVNLTNRKRFDTIPVNLEKYQTLRNKDLGKIMPVRNKVWAIRRAECESLYGVEHFIKSCETCVFDV